MQRNVNNPEFKEWLQENTTYSDRVRKDTVCRINRISRIIPLHSLAEEDLLKSLNESKIFNGFSMSVKSQCRHALKLYIKFLNANKSKKDK